MGKAQRCDNVWRITDGGVSVFRKPGGWGEADKVRWGPGACWGSGRQRGLRWEAAGAAAGCEDVLTLGLPSRTSLTQTAPSRLSLHWPYKFTYCIYCTNNIITERKIFKRQRIIHNHMPHVSFHLFTFLQVSLICRHVLTHL